MEDYRAGSVYVTSPPGVGAHGTLEVYFLRTLNHHVYSINKTKLQSDLGGRVQRQAARPARARPQRDRHSQGGRGALRTDTGGGGARVQEPPHETHAPRHLPAPAGTQVMIRTAT